MCSCKLQLVNDTCLRRDRRVPPGHCPVSRVYSLPPRGAPSEHLRRLALAQSELCQAVRLGKASAMSPPGSRNAIALAA
jgi:hypothetical protein